MKIQLLVGIGGFPAGSTHRVIQVIPHGGNTDESHQYLIQGQIYVPASKAREIVDETPGRDSYLDEKSAHLTLDALRRMNTSLREQLRECAMQAIAHDTEWEAWTLERAELRRQVDRLERENIDIKNQLADIKHEIEMNGWLR